MGRSAYGILAAALCALTGCGGGGGGGSSAPAVFVTPFAVAFPPQQLGSTSPPILVSVSNNGSAQLTVSAVQLTGANAGSFSDSTSCGTLAAGTSCVISLQFSPTSSGSASATLNIQSSARATTIPVSGQGTTGATWTTLANAP